MALKGVIKLVNNENKELDKENIDTCDIEIEEVLEEEQAAEEENARDAVEILTEENEKLNDTLLRTLAEYDNFRKRTQKEKLELKSFTISQTAEKILPIIDTFERAMSFECSDKEFYKGMEMTYNSFIETIKNLGIESIGEVGEEFNPSLHNAVAHLDDENLGENIVAGVAQKGYKIGDKVIRYAMVQVAN